MVILGGDLRTKQGLDRRSIYETISQLFITIHFQIIDL